MYGKKLIAAMAVLIFILCASMALGKRVNAPATDHGRPESPAFKTVKQEAIVLAANDNNRPDDTEKATSGSETKGSEIESKTTVEGKEKSSNTKPRPLKPFVPSEKIPGEQAVDFPVDI